MFRRAGAGRGWAGLALVALLGVAAGCEGETVEPSPHQVPDASGPGDITAKDTVLADAGSDASADVSSGLDAGPKDASAPFPTQVGSPPACTPPPGGYVVPALAKPSGDIEQNVSAVMTPVGVTETVALRVLQPGKTSTDAAAKGPLQVTGDSAIEVLSVEPLVAGKARARVRVTQPGAHQLTVTLPDGRQGQRELFAYQSKLPIWELDLAPADWKALIDNPYSGKYFPCKLTVDGKVHAGAQVRIHGGASKDMPKKSFRINLAKGDELGSGEDKLILRSEYIDKSMLRTWLGYEVFRTATWLPVPDVEFVHLRAQGEIYGVMNHVERIGGRFLTRNKRNPDGSLYEADPPQALASPGGNLTPLPSLELYQQIYPKHRGDGSYADLIGLIETKLQQADAPFHASIDQEVRVDDWLVYAATMAVIQNHEHVRKNYYLYRDATAKDPRWEIYPWDLDLTFGHLWSEANDVLEEEIVVDAPVDTGVQVQGHSFYNQMYRLLGDPALHQRWQDFIALVADLSLSDAVVDQRLTWATCHLGYDVLADPRKRAKNDEYLQRVDEIRAFAKGRRASLEAQIGK